MAFPESLKACIALSGGSVEHVAVFDDFLGTLTGTYPANMKYPYPALVGAGTPAGAMTSALGGTLVLTTTTISGDGSFQTFALNWTPANGIYAFWRTKMATITTGKMELGLTDSITNIGIINVKATPSFTCTDGAAFVYDTNHNGSMDFITCKAGAVGANAAGITLDTAYHNYEIKVSPGGFASGYIDGKFIGGGGITASATLTPQVAGVQTRTTAARTVTTDIWACVGSRS